MLPGTKDQPRLAPELDSPGLVAPMTAYIDFVHLITTTTVISTKSHHIAAVSVPTSPL